MTGLALLCFGISLSAFVVAYLLGREMHDAISARHWPEQEAVIRTSKLTRKFSFFYWPYFHYFVEISFEYRTPTARTVTCVLPSRFGTIREEYAEKIANHFEPGRKVPVHVHPRDPFRAFLMPGVERRDWANATLFAAIGLLGLLGAIGFAQL